MAEGRKECSGKEQHGKRLGSTLPLSTKMMTSLHKPAYLQLVSLPKPARTTGFLYGTQVRRPVCRRDPTTTTHLLSNNLNDPLHNASMMQNGLHAATRSLYLRHLSMALRPKRGGLEHQGQRKMHNTSDMPSIITLLRQFLFAILPFCNSSSHRKKPVLPTCHMD
jgi:hypothetical protein